MRGVGNIGDQLIAAGARALFAGRSYRELSLEEASRTRGATAVLSGGGGWCAPFHEIMPAALGVLETRFDRIVVLPSSFDVHVPAVCSALERTGALVFARELESFRAIEPFCRAALAHDTGFFFDYSPYAMHGSGVLQAFRGDAEASGGAPVARGNRDISVDLHTLDEWLWTIARSAEVHTDRAHVMIAAALLGKHVVVHPSSYHKVPAIAAYALHDFDVHVEPRRNAPRILPHPATPDVAALRERLRTHGLAQMQRIPRDLSVTIAIVTHNRPVELKRCVDSIRAHVRIPHELLVLDNASDAAMRAEVASSCDVQLLERNHGCAGARHIAASRATTDVIVFIDDDAEVFPGTIEQLVNALEENPELVAAGANIVLPHGRVQFCGGATQQQDGVISFIPLSRGLPFDDPSILSTECQWVGGTTFAVRTRHFDEFPIDLRMDTYFEDNEWCHRVSLARPHAFRRVAGALVLHHQQPKERLGSDAAERVRALDFITPLARFYERHGLVQEDLFAFVPELTVSGERDVRAARLLLELVNAKGRDWFLTQWLHGGLTPIFAADDRVLRELEETRNAFHAFTSTKLGRLTEKYWNARRRLSAFRKVRA